jgi:hypothetical protein
MKIYILKYFFLKVHKLYTYLLFIYTDILKFNILNNLIILFISIKRKIHINNIEENIGLNKIEINLRQKRHIFVVTVR